MAQLHNLLFAQMIDSRQKMNGGHEARIGIEGAPGVWGRIILEEISGTPREEWYCGIEPFAGAEEAVAYWRDWYVPKWRRSI